MSKKYCEMEVLIKAIVCIPMEADECTDYAVECVEMSDDIVDIAENIERNDKEFYIDVNRKTVKELEL
ncbi:MAG: hypothetical protein RSA29_04490 [Clostridium sp.]|uniref:hypothetical protein n=1 Tax=Clostridium sp. TaxID=1506 RepID=UPI0030699EFB